MLFARYSRVSRDIRELFGATNNLLFGVYPLDIHVYSVLNNYILHSETAGLGVVLFRSALFAIILIILFYSRRLRISMDNV